MPAIIIKSCPRCGNKVQGVIVNTLARKITRGTIKKGSAMATGAVIGSIVPGVGTLVGAGLGVVAGALMEDKIKEASDITEDALFDNPTYQFTCPNCGFIWERTETGTRINVGSNVNYQSKTIVPHPVKKNNLPKSKKLVEAEKTDVRDAKKQIISVFSRIEHDNAIDFSEYRTLRSKSLIQHYSLSVINSLPAPVDYKKVASRVSRDTGYTIYDWQIKADRNHSAETKLTELLSLNVDRNNFNWRNLIKNFPLGNKSDKYNMIVYHSGYLKEQGNFLIGVCVSGCISVGDSIVLCTDTNESYKTKVSWIEMFGRKFESSEAGNGLGMGIDIDLGTISGSVRSVLKNNEVVENGNEKDNKKTELTSKEQEYLSELKEILSDGEISPRERRLLDKIREQLSISEERAAELEASLSSPSLTPEEQEYLDEYKEIVAEGEISARDQRFLDKLKKANGISEERAKEIEALI